MAVAGEGTSAGVTAGGDAGAESRRGEGTSATGAAGDVLDGAGAQPATSITTKTKRMRIMIDFISYLCQLSEYAY